MEKYNILRKYFGYDNFRYPQDIIIDSILNGNDVIAVCATGFGKTLIFNIPALIFPGVSIIISPLISLMKDQVDNLSRKKINAKYISSDLSYQEKNEIYKDIVNQKIKMVFVSPERLESNSFIYNISKIDVSMIVIDEAHTILWGEGFRSSYLKIANFIKTLKRKPVVVALTATATLDTIKKIKYYLNVANAIVYYTDIDRKKLYYQVIETNHKNQFLLNYLANKENDKGIIYCLSRKKTKELYDFLQAKNIDCQIYHGGMNIDSKTTNQNLFNKTSNLIICTNAFGMGIDIPNIRFVICYEPPVSIEDLVQQLGRAGRDGKEAYGLVLFSFNDLNTLRYFVYSSNDNENILNQNLKKFNKLVDYCLYRGCRHQFISKYFGQKKEKCNFMCDNCYKKYR